MYFYDDEEDEEKLNLNSDLGDVDDDDDVNPDDDDDDDDDAQEQNEDSNPDDSNNTEDNNNQNDNNHRREKNEKNNEKNNESDDPQKQDAQNQNGQDAQNKGTEGKNGGKSDDSLDPDKVKNDMNELGNKPSEGGKSTSSDGASTSPKPSSGEMSGSPTPKGSSPTPNAPTGGAPTPTPATPPPAAPPPAAASAATSGAATTGAAATGTGAAAGAGAAGGAAAGAGAGAGAAATAATPVGWVLLIIAAIIVIIIVAIGIAMFFVAMPGQIVGKFKSLGNSVIKAWSAMMHGEDQVVTTSQIAGVAAYVEKMGYDLKGEGFVTYDKTSADIQQTINDIRSWTSVNYDSELADMDLESLLVADETQGVIRRSDTNEVVDLNSDSILTYIISDNQCYMIKNLNANLDGMTDGNGDFWGGVLAVAAAIVGVIVAIVVPGGFIVSLLIGAAAGSAVAGVSYLAVTTASNPNWGTGLISIYHEASMGVKDGYYDMKEKGYIDLDPNSKKLIVKRGWANGEKVFSVDGWSGRYGMPLEFLLSVHLATQMPDLAIDMATAFDTDVELLLHEVTGSVTAGVLKEGHSPSSNDDFITYETIAELGTEEQSLGQSIWEGIKNAVNDAADFFTGDKIWTSEELDELGINAKVMCLLFDDGFPHSVDCTCCSHINGSKKAIIDSETCEDDTDLYDSGGDIDNDHVICEKCKNRVFKIIAALAVSNDKEWETYTPYISKVKNHWFRDVYFVMNSSEKEIDKSVITVDEEYFYETGERWTMYEVWEEGDSIPEGFTVGDYKLYEYSYNESTEKETYTLSTKTKAQAQEINEKIAQGDTSVTRLVKKPITNKMATNFDDGWSAYKISDPEQAEATASWEQISVSEDSKGELLEDAVYKNEDSSVPENILIYYKEILPGDIEQIEDGQRTETNPKIKNMFLNKKYYKYDGSIDRANAIMKDKARSDNKGEDYNTANDARDEKLIAKVDINKDSLGAFSILENTHTLDADYIYRDFKELIVELNYFDKEDLSDKIQEVMQWVIPECGSAGWPIRKYEKGETFYGTLINSKVDLELMRAYDEKQIRQIEQENSEDEETQRAEEELEEFEKNNPIPDSENSTSALVGRLSFNDNTDLKSTILVGQLTGSPVDIQSSSKNGAKYEITINGVTYIRYLQGGQSYSGNTFTWSGSTKTIGQAACGPTSMVNILTGYGYDYNPEQNITGLNFDATCEGLANLYEQWTDGGTSQAFYSDFEQHMVEAFEEGKPVIVLTNGASRGYPDNFWTTGGHFVACLGVDESGNLITADPAGSGNYERMVYPGGISGIVQYMSGMWVPDEAPSGVVTGKPFEGYEPEQDVVAPITGKVIEIGEVERENIETGEMETVDFIKIQAMDHYVTAKEGTYVKEKCTTVDSEYDPENTYDTQKLEGYDYFYEEYKGVLDGCILYMEGFELTNFTGNKSDNIASTYTGEMDAPEITRYEPNIVYNMNDDLIEAKSLWKEDAKKAATPFFTDSEGNIYVKEGTVIGKTMKDPDLTTEQQEEQRGNGNYIRLILRDLEDSIMEDVETYFKISNAGNKKCDFEQFAYYLGCLLEGFYESMDSGSNYGVEVLNDGAGNTTAFGLTSAVADTVKSTYPNFASHLAAGSVPKEEAQDVFILVLEAAKESIQNQLNTKLEDDDSNLFALMDLHHASPAKCQEVIEIYNSKNNNFTKEELVSVFSEHWGSNENYGTALRMRGTNRGVLASEGRFLLYQQGSEGDEVVFESETPWSEFCDAGGTYEMTRESSGLYHIEKDAYTGYTVSY